MFVIDLLLHQSAVWVLIRLTLIDINLHQTLFCAGKDFMIIRDLFLGFSNQLERVAALCPIVSIFNHLSDVLWVLQTISNSFYVFLSFI